MQSTLWGIKIMYSVLVLNKYDPRTAAIGSTAVAGTWESCVAVTVTATELGLLTEKGAASAERGRMNATRV